MTGDDDGIEGWSGAVLARGFHPPPSLPLQGGRDELGKEASVGLGAELGEIPAASAGMTDLGARV